MWSTAVTDPNRFVTSMISTSGLPSPADGRPPASSRRTSAGGAAAVSEPVPGVRDAVNGCPRGRTVGAERRPCSLATGGPMVGGTPPGVNAASVRISHRRAGAPSPHRDGLNLYFRRLKPTAVRTGEIDDDRTPAWPADPGAAPGAAAHPAGRRGAVRRHGELPLAGGARRREPFDRDRGPHRPCPRPLDRPAVRLGAGERARGPSGGTPPGGLPGAPVRGRVPDLEHGRPAPGDHV